MRAALGQRAGEGEFGESRLAAAAAQGLQQGKGSDEHPPALRQGCSLIFRWCLPVGPRLLAGVPTEFLAGHPPFRRATAACGHG
ncbi:hypothetical protein GCM10010245_12430 [Streptomyces spectabilis]|nr:hypothetical protein GCM10010245_12430 [Streptomyces spectabilis]